MSCLLGLCSIGCTQQAALEVDPQELYAKTPGQMHYYALNIDGETQFRIDAEAAEAGYYITLRVLTEGDVQTELDGDRVASGIFIEDYVRAGDMLTLQFTGQGHAFIALQIRGAQIPDEQSMSSTGPIDIDIETTGDTSSTGA